MFLPLGTMDIHTLTGRKLWFRARFLGVGAILKDGTEFTGPFFSVDDNLYMLVSGAGNSPDSCFVEFIQIDEPARPVVIETAEVVLRPVVPTETMETRRNSAYGTLEIPFGAWEPRDNESDLERARR